MIRGAIIVTCLACASAYAQPSAGEPSPSPTPTTDPSAGPTVGAPPAAAPATTPGPGESSAATAEKKQETAAPPAKKKEPGRGDFDAGGQARFPSGPDETGGNFKSFNWVAVDARGRYYILDHVTADAIVPLAVKKPDSTMVGGAMVDPKLFGGFLVRLEAKAAMPNLPIIAGKGTEAGISLTFGYMRERAMLLSEKDYPLFTGDLKPGFAGGVPIKVKLSSLVDFSLVPAWVYQSATLGSLTAVQVPMSLRLALGELVKVSADAGVFTGDDYSFSGSKGGRIAAGGALDVKIYKVIVHAGAGVASLLTGGVYPTIGDSVYVDLNVKYAK
jgi:hypothetical protein